MPTESMMPSNHLTFCHPLLLLPSMFPSIRVFSNESALCIRWPKYWSFSFSISLYSSEYSELISCRMDWWISSKSKGLSRVFSSTTVWKHQFFSTQFTSCRFIFGVIAPRWPFWIKTPVSCRFCMMPASGGNARAFSASANG